MSFQELQADGEASAALQARKLSLLHSLVEQFESLGHGGSCAVVHGLTPDGVVGRDVDFIVDTARCGFLADIAVQHFLNRGMQVARMDVPRGVLVFIASLEPSDFFCFEVDLAVGFDWFLINLIRTPSRNDVYTVSGVPCARWGGFAKRLLLQFLCGQISKYRRAEKAHEFRVFPEEKEEARRGLIGLFGKNNASALLSAIEAEDWAWFERHRRHYQLCLIFRSLLRSPWKIVLGAAKRYRIIRDLAMLPPSSPRVFFSPDEQGGFSQFWKEFKQFALEHSVFHTVVYHPVSGANDLARLQRSFGDWVRQPLVLHCFPLVSGFCDDKYSLVINWMQTTPEQAVLEVARKHFEILETI